MSKKVLVISYIATMASMPNGRTMQSLLQGIPADHKSLFCCYGTPDSGSCGACYKLTNRDVLMSLVKPAAAGSEIDVDIHMDAAAAISADMRKGGKKAWKYLAKELVWVFGSWKNKKLMDWLRRQAADCIVYMYGDNAALQNFAVFASKLLNIPLIVYSCEDYCMKDYNYIDGNNHSLAFKWYHWLSRKATAKLIKQASGLITNSDQLAVEYSEKYGIDNTATVMMASDMEYIENADVRPVEEMRVVYLGAIGDYRVKALVEIGETLQRINPCLKLDVYGKIQDDRIRERLCGCSGINYRGFVSYDQVRKIMRGSSLMIEAINDDPYICKDKRYGFSTKYADCFACGTPFLVYAPDAIIETRFAKEHRCAFVADSFDQLQIQLQQALFDRAARRSQLEAARNVTLRYFSKAKNIDIVNTMIEAVVADNR